MADRTSVTTLDPQAADFVANNPGFAGAENAGQARANHLASAPTLSGPPDPVAEVRDVEVAGGDGPLPARLVRPAGSTSEDVLPLVVLLHGGGWVVGTLDTYAPVQHALANAAHAAVLSVDYRLAPEHPHPAAVADALAATAWALDRAADLGADASRTGVFGDSAGGHLAAVTARHLADRLAFQVLVYPVTDATASLPSYDENATGFFLEAEGMRWYWRQYMSGAEPSAERAADPDLSPLHARLHGPLPPAFVLTAGFDPLRDEGAAYADRLEAAGTTVVRYPVDGQIHGFVRFLATMDAARPSLSAAAAFVRHTVV